MGQIVVRNLDYAVIEQLKAKAKSANESLEQTVRELLTEAARSGGRADAIAFAAQMRLRTAQRKSTFNAAAAIRHDRDTDHDR